MQCLFVSIAESRRNVCAIVWRIRRRGRQRYVKSPVLLVQEASFRTQGSTSTLSSTLCPQAGQNRKVSTSTLLGIGARNFFQLIKRSVLNQLDSDSISKLRKISVSALIFRIRQISSYLTFSKLFSSMSYLAGASNLKGSPGRKLVAAGVVGAVAVIALIVGVMVIQTGSNVSLYTTTSSLSPSSTSARTRSSSSSQSTTSHSSMTSTSYSGPTGILGVSLTDPPIVPPGVSAVYITYSSVQVHVGDAGNQDGWYTVADAGSVDLMSLLNVSLTLGSAQVQTGVFNLISFNISSAAITLNGLNQTAYVPANRISVPIRGRNIRHQRKHFRSAGRSKSRSRSIPEW